MKTRHHTNLKILTLTVIILATMPLAARAELFGSCTVDPNLLVMTQTMLTLSTDIGTMADRILVTEDKIGDMADRILITEDKIGVMADRIVTTEELLATTLQQLNQSGGLTANKPGVLLTSPLTGDVVLRNTAPILQLSDNATSYVVYLSPTASFTSDQVLPLLVTPQTPLANSWTQAAQSISAGTIYIAVRSVIGEATLSELSNAIRVTLQ